MFFTLLIILASSLSASTTTTHLIGDAMVEVIIYNPEKIAPGKIYSNTRPMPPMPKKPYTFSMFILSKDAK